MKKILDDAQIQIVRNEKLIKKQMDKKFDYKFEDFEIVPIHKGASTYKWRHKSWKTYCSNPNKGYTLTALMVEHYINECKKPYGKRDLSFVHII